MADVPSFPPNDFTLINDEAAKSLQRFAAVIAKKSGVDLNQSLPPVEFDATTKKRLFEAAPVPIKRMFGSPLVMNGKFSIGKNGERKVSSGWGDPRTSTSDNVNKKTTHKGLDFAAPFGEEVLACADGIVTFVGYQPKMSAGGGVQVRDCREDITNGNILGTDGKIVAYAQDAQGNARDVGDGGIFIYIQHNDDFEGYRTEYFHLSETLVNIGDKENRVHEGQVIGKTGGSGGAWGFYKRKDLIHLHWQVSFIAPGANALVNPTALVPNCRPGHPDSISSGQIASQLPLDWQATPFGVAIMHGAATLGIQTAERAVAMENQGLIEHKQAQAEHSELIYNSIITQHSALYATIMAFQGKSPTVVSPMVFDFNTGTWLPDGKAV